jgi:hypothetical protein
MRKLGASKYLLFVLGLLVWSGVFLVSVPSASAAAARCFSQDNLDRARTEFFANNDAFCKYDLLLGSGYNMTGLPNPLNADACYYWTADVLQPPQTLACSDPKVVGAVADDNSAAPPANINNIGGAAKAPNNQLNEINTLRCDSASGQTEISSNCIVDRVNMLINLFSVGVGLVVIIMIIIGGIRYAMAGGDPQAVAKAKSQIRNALIALVAYLFLFAALQWIVPGGIV